MHNSRISPAIEDRVLELAKQLEWRQRMFHFVLSSIQDPSERVVDTLAEGLLDNGEVRSSAMHGLRNPNIGFEGKRADAFLKLVDKNKSPHVQQQALQALQALHRMGLGERHAAALERLISSGHFASAPQKYAQAIVKQIREREARGR
jgi:hypothetical protein